MTFSDLPTLNAFLNTCSTVFLLIGFYHIRRKNIDAHRKAIFAAFTTSALFLVSYLIYHYEVGSVKFTGEGIIRTIYFTILLSHTVLAIAVPPLAILSAVRGLRNQVAAHKKIARWTLPIWLYVSVTGIIIYLMLYKFFPASGLPT